MGILNTFVALLLLTVNTCWSQQSQSSLVHLDKPFYVSGEMVHYQIYFPIELQDHQLTLEVLIYNQTGSVVHQSFLRKEPKNISHGYFKLPYELSSGLYRLVTNVREETSSRSISVANASLPVYNPLSPVTTSGDKESEVTLPWPEAGFPLDITAQIQPQSIGPGELVKLTAVVRDSQGNPVKSKASISVTDTGITGGSDFDFRTLYSTPVSLSNAGRLSQYIPVSGQLKSGKSGELLTFYQVDNQRIHYTTTGEQGNFELQIPEFYGNQRIDYLGQFSDGDIVQFAGAEPIESSGSLPYSEAVGNYIKHAQKRRNIYQLFNTTESVYHYRTAEIQDKVVPDQVYQTENYPFPDLPSFCRGLSTQLKYIKDKNAGRHIFKIFDPESRNFYFGTPLFMVDGQITKDVEYLESLDFSVFERIEMFYDSQRLNDYFGFAGFSGVVVITSKQGNLTVPEHKLTQEFTVAGLQPELIIYNAPENNPDEPDFRPQLLWRPALETDAEGKLELSYYQSDDISRFQIEIVAQSEDGSYGYGKLEY